MSENPATVPEWMGRLATANERIADLEADHASLAKAYDGRYRELIEARASLRRAEAELAALRDRRCEDCADHGGDEPCDRFSEPFLAFMRDHCNGKPVSCSFWAERGTP